MLSDDSTIHETWFLDFVRAAKVDRASNSNQASIVFINTSMSLVYLHIMYVPPMTSLAAERLIKMHRIKFPTSLVHLGFHMKTAPFVLFLWQPQGYVLSLCATRRLKWTPNNSHAVGGHHKSECKSLISQCCPSQIMWPQNELNANEICPRAPPPRRHRRTPPVV